MIQTRSHTPSPVPDANVEAESNEKEPVSPLPAEYQPEAESKESSLQSFPAHYNRSLRASAMCLSSEDCFSRRITSLGVYYPKDRLKQERQFARVVLELLAKKVVETRGGDDSPVSGAAGSSCDGKDAKEGSENKGESACGGAESECSGATDRANDHVTDHANDHVTDHTNDLTTDHTNECNSHTSGEDASSRKNPPTPIPDTNAHHTPRDDATAENTTSQTDAPPHDAKDGLPTHAILSSTPTVMTSVLDSLSQSAMPCPKSERMVTILDQIQPPPANVRPSLRLTNPDRLILVQEDDRENVHAPRTPANVRGKRSLLHKAVLTSEQATLDFINQQGGNRTAVSYFVNQADPHGFTPLMTAVCLSDPVAAMNITKMLVENVPSAPPFHS